MPILNRLYRDTAGNTAMIVALCLPVLMAIVGGAIDFGRATQLRMAMQDAADIAVLSAVSVNSPGYKEAASKGDGGDDSDYLTGKAQALAVFTSNMAKRSDLTTAAPVVTMSKSQSTLTAKITVSASYKPYLLGLVGFSSIPLAVTATSTAGMPPYIDFHLLLDNSPSMGVGATTADINKMVASTSDKCAFACHQMDKPSTDYYAKAKALGVTTRIDVVRQATQKLMVTAKTSQTLSGQYRVSIYDFGLSADSIDAKSPGPYQISSLTTDLDLSATKAAAIDLMTIPYQGYNSDRQTSFKSVLGGMNIAIPASGDGTAAKKPQQVLFFVSDGANDSYDCAYSNGNTCRRITPLDTTQCNAMKARGVRIAVLYTTYLPLPTNSFYNQYMAKYVTPTSQLASQMEACASPGLYFEVSPSEGISEAMTALFNKVVSVVRIKS